MAKSDLSLEMRVLRSACDSPDRIRMYILPLLKEQHFSTSMTAHIFKRILKLYVSTNHPPAWSSLRHDPGIRKDARVAMREAKQKPFTKTENIRSAFKTLEGLRQVRAMFELGANLEEKLSGDAIDVEEVLKGLQNDLTKVGSNTHDTVITSIGRNSNVKKVLKKILTEGGQRRIPTGVREFDAKNIGFPMGGVVILAANTGGFKTGVANNIIHHMAMLGSKCALLPLEMDDEENLQRDLARVTQVSYTNIIDPLKKLTESERRKMYKAYMKYDEDMAARGGCVDIIQPGFESNIENILNYLDPLDYDVILIDYVGLMAGVNGDDQWRALSNAVAYAKRWAGRSHKKTLIIFCAQLTEEGFLKQSKAMADHCTNVWTWRVGDEERESGIVPIHQNKCRGGAVFDIPMMFDFEHMTSRSLTQKETDDWILASKSKQGKGDSWKSGGGKRSSKKSKEERVDLPEDEDDDDSDNGSSGKKPKSKSDRRGGKQKPRRANYEY